MNTAIVASFVAATAAASALLVRRFLPGNTLISAIGFVLFWTCGALLSVQLIGFLNIIGLVPFLRPSHLLLVSAMGLACSFVVSGRSPGAVGSRDSSAPIPRHVVLGLVCAAGIYGLLVLRILIAYPDAWDAVAYHYPVALRWLQDGTMKITTDTNWHASLPGNVEILEALVLLSGLPHLLGAVEWPAAALLLLASMAISRRFSSSKVPSYAVATTVALIPMVAKQTFSGYVDLFGVAGLFASLALVLEFHERSRDFTNRAMLVAAGIGCGIAVGVKPVFWFYALLLTVNVAAILRNRWRDLGFYVAGAVLPCWFWFVRAAIATGNPLYPISLHIGPVILAGFPLSAMANDQAYLTSVRHAAEWFVYPWLEWKRAIVFPPENYTTGDGLGAAFATFVMPGLGFAAWLSWKRRPELRPWLFNLAIVAIAWWFLMRKFGRYGIAMFVLAAILATPLFELLEKHRSGLYRSIYVVAFAMTSLLLAVEPLSSVGQTLRHHWDRADYFGYPAKLDSLPAGSRILNIAEETFNFSLSGKGLTNVVIPSWEKPALLTADYLRGQKIDYIVERVGTVDALPPAPGLELMLQDAKLDPAHIWRIWRTAK